MANANPSTRSTATIDQLNLENRNRASIAWDEGNSLTGAGYALHTLADLLGADGSEHFLSEGDVNGLLHAVQVIGAAVLNSGVKLAGAAELAGVLEVDHV